MTATRTITEDTFGDRMRTARKTAGMSLEAAARLLENNFGISLRDETIRKYEVGHYNETNADPVVVVGLANIYGVKTSTLSPAIAKRAKKLRDLLVGTPGCITDSDILATAA